MRRVLTIALSLAVATCVIAVQAFSQSPGASTPATTLLRQIRRRSRSNITISSTTTCHGIHVVPILTTRTPTTAWRFLERLLPPAPGRFFAHSGKSVSGQLHPRSVCSDRVPELQPHGTQRPGRNPRFLPTKGAVVYLNGQKMRGTGQGPPIHHARPTGKSRVSVLGDCNLRHKMARA